MKINIEINNIEELEELSEFIGEVKYIQKTQIHNVNKIQNLEQKNRQLNEKTRILESVIQKLERDYEELKNKEV